jgi:hypothetical protein
LGGEDAQGALPCPPLERRREPLADELERRRVAGFAAVGFAVVRLVVARFVVVRFVVVRFAGVAEAVVADPGEAFAAGFAALVGVVAVAAFGLDAADAAAFAAGFRVVADRRPLDAGFEPAAPATGRAWSAWIAASSAVSSSISSRTSWSRAVRRSRLRLVAFSSRPDRHVSSDFAAARANSSHSTWRASAIDGVIFVADRFGPDGASDGVALDGSVIVSPRDPLGAILADASNGRSDGWVNGA